MIKIQSLSQKKQFREILGEKKINNEYFTIYYGKNNNKFSNNNKNLNISFPVKKKIGNAVKRNKIRRKLRSAVNKILKNEQTIDLNYTYIIFGKTDIYKEKFAVILNKINDTFKKIKSVNG